MSPRSSCQSFRRLAWIGAAVCSLFLSGGWIGPSSPTDPAGAEAFWRTGVPRSIAVRGGRATFRVPTVGPAAQTLVIVSALTRDRGPFSIKLTARPTSTATIPELADDGHCTAPKTEPAPKVPPPPAPSTRAGHLPPRDRVFHLMVHQGDPGSRRNYVEVRSVLKGVGHRVQVYVGSEDINKVALSTIEDLITTFDERIYPKTCEHYGAARDIDGDGRFTVLLSSWLDHLGSGRRAIDGFVKVADLDAAVPAPFGNRCDMMYLNAGLQAGPYLRTILAHEYMHAVVYTFKTLEHSEGGEPGPEEEGWLDEALAHLAEDLHGFSASNIDYRVSAFLSQPEHYQLLVDDYFAENLFRSHGNRGSTYLFLRWCVDRYGPDLIPTLIRSPRRGVANLETATGSTFAALYRRWTLALFLSGLDASNPLSDAAGDGFRSINLHALWADCELAGPRFQRVIPGGPPDCWEATGTSSHYIVIDGRAAGAVEVEVEGPSSAELQVTALPMGQDRARMTLTLQPTRQRDGNLTILAHVSEDGGVPVRLSAFAWEPLVPSACPRVSGRHAGRMDILGIAASFGTSLLPARGMLQSRPIPIPAVATDTGPIVLKVIGTDPRGQRVTAWADFPAPAGNGSGQAIRAHLLEHFGLTWVR
jgi:hypothetical protein